MAKQKNYWDLIEVVLQLLILKLMKLQLQNVSVGKKA